MKRKLVMPMRPMISAFLVLLVLGGFGAVVPDDRESATRLFAEAEQALRKADRTTAQDLFQKLGRLDIDEPEFHFNMSVLAEALGETDSAILGYHAVIASDPTHLDAYLNLGALYLSKASDMNNLAEKALAVYEAAARRFPAVSKLQVALGTAYSALELNNEALGAFRKAAGLDPQSPAAARALGAFLLHLGRNDEARGSIEKAMRLAPKDAYPHYYLALLLSRDSSIPTARPLAELDRATDLDPGFTKAWIEKAKVLQRAEKLEEAAKALERALALDPNNPRSHYQLSRLYYQLGQFDKAKQAESRHLELKRAQQRAAAKSLP